MVYIHIASLHTYLLCGKNDVAMDGFQNKNITVAVILYIPIAVGTIRRLI